MPQVTKLEELNVLYVSGVKYPATKKNFFLKKEAAWMGFVTELRKSQPDVATLLDTMLSEGRYSDLREAVKGIDPMVLPELDEMLEKLQTPAESDEWDEYEPTEKDLDGIEAEQDGIVCVLYKRAWSADARRKHKEAGGKFAGPNMSYPIKSCEDVHAAYMSAGRAKQGSPEGIRKNVVRIAKDMKLTRCLPQSVKDKITEKEVSGTMTDDEILELEKKHKAQTPPPDEDGEDQWDDEEGEEEETPKRAKKSLVGSLVEAAARGAGYEVVPAGTITAIKHIAIVLDAIQAGKSLLKDDQEDDVPVGEEFGLLDDRTQFTQAAPMDDLHGGAQGNAAVASKGAMGQQPDVAQGTPATTQNMQTTVQGTPVQGTPPEQQVSQGEPVTKADIAALLDAVTALKAVVEDNTDAMDEIEERLSNVEAAKGISHVEPPEEDERPAHKSAGVWSNSAFDVNV